MSCNITKRRVQRSAHRKLVFQEARNALSAVGRAPPLLRRGHLPRATAQAWGERLSGLRDPDTRAWA